MHIFYNAIINHKEGGPLGGILERNILATWDGEETRIEFNPLPEDSNQEEFPFFPTPKLGRSRPPV